MDRSFLSNPVFCIHSTERVMNIAQYAPIRVLACSQTPCTTSELRDVRVTLLRPVESIQKPARTGNYFSYYIPFKTCRPTMYRCVGLLVCSSTLEKKKRRRKKKKPVKCLKYIFYHKQTVDIFIFTFLPTYFKFAYICTFAVWGKPCIG